MQSSNINNNFKQIPTIRQVYNNLRDAHDELEQVFTRIGVVPLQSTQDLQNKKITINQVVRSIPTEQRLQNLSQYGTKQTMREHMARYNGDISLIQKAKQNFSELKKQQQKIYYLSSQSQMLSVSPQFKLFKQKQDDILLQLHSYKDVTNLKSTKSKTLQKNTISDLYLQQGYAQLDSRNQSVTKFTKKTQQLKKFDLLVHVNFYDSHNNQKQYEFICLLEQNLGSLVQKFKCLIDTLSNIQRIRKKQQKIEDQSYEVYDKFYNAPPQRNIIKHCNYKIQHNPSPSSIKFLIIEDAVYYQGNRNDLQSFIQIAHNKYKINYQIYQMSKTKLCNLRVIYGKPYLYRHMQGCDHIIIFKQARLFMGNDQYNHDVMQIQKYPITVFESKMKRKKCQSCAEYFSDIVAICDPHKQGNNLYICRQCHQDLHFGQNGRPKMGDKIKFVNYIHD